MDAPQQYRKLPVTVDAIQWTGHDRDAVAAFAGAAAAFTTDQDGHEMVAVATLEGVMKAAPGAWLVRGVEGELYPCADSVFRATYEPAGSPTQETWALKEWLQHDYDLMQAGRAIAAGDPDDAVIRVEEWVTKEVWWDAVKTHRGCVMVLDIGSMWRIDWHEITKVLRAAPDPMRPATSA